MEKKRYYKKESQVDRQIDIYIEREEMIEINRLTDRQIERKKEEKEY